METISMDREFSCRNSEFERVGRSRESGAGGEGGLSTR
jgi:hypothetical protein